MTRRFQRRIENFICLSCGKQVCGDGFTNHCPYCLWGKHVDINPGDRAEPCHGAMEPISVEPGEPGKITHRCNKCGKERRNKIQKDDDFEAILRVISARDMNRREKEFYRSCL